MNSLIQLPGDVKQIKQILNNDYTVTTIYESKKHNFIGSKKDFLNNDLAYQYRQIDKYTRETLKNEYIVEQYKNDQLVETFTTKQFDKTDVRHEIINTLDISDCYTYKYYIK